MGKKLGAYLKLKVRLLLLLLCMISIVHADDWSSGTEFVTDVTDFTFTAIDDFSCDALVVGDYCVNITGGVKAGSYCVLTDSLNISLVSCLSSWSVIPTNASIAVGPVGQSTAGCAFNVTNNEGFTIPFMMKYTGGDLTYTYDYDLDTFINIWDEYTSAETVWENTSNYTIVVNASLNYTSQYNWTRLCFHADKYTANYTQGLSSMRVTYNFNNSDDVDMEYYNYSHYVPINTTWGCLTSNYVKFTPGREEFDDYETISFSYKLLSGGSVNMTLNLTDNLSASMVTSSFLIDNTSWNNKSYTISGIDQTNISSYAFHFTGSSDGKVLIDNLHLNATTTERKIDLFASNSTYANSVNMTSTLTTVFNVTGGQTMPLNLWFKYYAPLHGTTFSFADLYYETNSSILISGWI